MKNRCFAFCCLLFCLICTPILSAAETSDKNPQVTVLIVTGIDYPGHPWQAIAPKLSAALAARKDIHVRLCEDIEVLGTDMIFDYDVLLLNFKNYDPLKREKAARENLVRFIREGGGLMYYHFTGGAFQDWPEYKDIAGRVWNPDFRGHDPYQKFTVNILKKDHPAMRGVEDFQITDELYTCMDGDREIEVLASAESSVDGKTYPMVFVFSEGKGRGFHTVLGHDTKAFESPELATLLQQGVLWCAKREDIIEKTGAKTPSQKLALAEVRIAEITGSLPQYAKLLSYIDCGGETNLDKGVKITPPENAKPYRFEMDKKIEGVSDSQSSVLFAPGQLDFMLEGLDRAKKYQLNITWWDYDSGGRSQSILVKTPDHSMVRILRPGVSLPDFKENGLPPKTISCPLPMAFVREGKLLLSIKSEGGPNAVVSEIWITGTHESR